MDPQFPVNPSQQWTAPRFSAPPRSEQPGAFQPNMSSNWIAQPQPSQRSNFPAPPVFPQPPGVGLNPSASNPNFSKSSMASSSPATSSQGLPLPFHGQAQYSHQLDNRSVSGMSSAPSAQNSRKPSPIPTPLLDNVEGQFGSQAVNPFVNGGPQHTPSPGLNSPQINRHQPPSEPSSFYPPHSTQMQPSQPTMPPHSLNYIPQGPPMPPMYSNTSSPMPPVPSGPTSARPLMPPGPASVRPLMPPVPSGPRPAQPPNSMRPTGPPMPPMPGPSNVPQQSWNSDNRYPTSPPLPQPHGNPMPQPYMPPSAPNAATSSQNRPSYPPQPPSNAPNAPFHWNQGGVMHSVNTGFNQMQLGSSRTVNLLQERTLFDAVEEEPPKPQVKNSKVSCDPDIMRCTLNAIPHTASLLAKVRLPLGLLLQPFKQPSPGSSIPVIQPSVIVRCRYCRTYINPFVSFPDNRRWKCNVCFRQNDLPDEFQYDPISKVYGEPQRRPEIRSSSIEFIAPAEYMLRPPQPAVYVYLLEVSGSALSSGYLEVACNTLLDNLDRIPGDSRTQMAFITYNSGIQYYKINGDIPRMMVCPDIEDVFLPDHDSLLVNLIENKETIRELLSYLPDAFAECYDTGNCLGSALQAALKLIGSTGGRITVMNTCLPNLGPGLLKSREDNNQRASSTVTNLGPATDFYKSFALECSGQQVAVDLFLISSLYSDVATLAGAARYSGGSLAHYPDFHLPDNSHPQSRSPAPGNNSTRRRAEVDRFRQDLSHYLTRKIGFETVLRVRCTRGLGIQAFHGNCFVRSTDLLSLPNVNPDAGFAVQMSIEDSLSDLSNVCIQSALLYTSSQGERRIRVHTLCIPLTGQVDEVFRTADHIAIATLLAKMAVDRCVASGMQNARDALVNATVDALSAYGKLCLGASGNTSHIRDLPLPYHLRCLPMYASALLKSRALRVGVSTKLDVRCAAMERFKNLPHSHLIAYIYPKLYPLHTIMDDSLVTKVERATVSSSLNTSGNGTTSSQSSDDEEEESQDNTGNSGFLYIPRRLHLSSQFLERNGAYLMDVGDQLLLLLCSSLSSDFCENVFGVQSITQVPDGASELPRLNNPLSKRVRDFIRDIQLRRPAGNVLTVIRDDSPYRVEFLERLYDDRLEAQTSYVEFLQQLSKMVKYT